MFTSQANKELIWGLLKEQSNIRLTENWKSFFEEQIQAIHTNRHQYRSMVEMNKHLIAICMANLEEIGSRTERRYDEYQINKGSGRYAHDLKNKQEDLKKLQGGLKPPDIDFTANNDNAYGNLNQIMERQMADRQKDLAEIGKGYTTDAKAWLNISEKSGAPKLKIGLETPKLRNEIINAPKKKVKFKLGSDIYVKLNYNEDGVNKNIILKLSDNFRLVSSFQEDLNTSTNITLENVEVFTKSG